MRTGGRGLRLGVRNGRKKHKLLAGTSQKYIREPCMKCTKCIEHKWMDAQESVYTDAEGIEYCEFHAPSGHKGISNEEFKIRVASRITDILDVAILEGTTSPCNFSGTIFSCEIFFHIRKFNNRLHEISFDYCVFEGKAHFELINFEHRATFSYAEFKDVACFMASVFAKDVSFVHTIFCFAEFHGTVFMGKVSFSKTVFADNATFFACEAGDNKIIIHDVDASSLEKIDFTSREVEYIDFIECRFNIALKPERTGLHLRAEELYRSLKQKAARKHDQPMVSEWHYREKLMFMRQKWYRRFVPITPTWLYWASSGFGERSVRAWWILVGLCFVSFLLFGYEKLFEVTRSSNPDWMLLGTVFDEWSLCVPFIQAGIKGAAIITELEPWKIRTAWVFQILIAIQASLFAFALRNRFRR